MKMLRYVVCKYIYNGNDTLCSIYVAETSHHVMYMNGQHEDECDHSYPNSLVGIVVVLDM